MEFEGVVYKILPLQSGTSARGEWQRQDVVFELPQEYSRKICVTFFNRPGDVALLREGATYTVSINIESREYNGRWYTDIRAWRLQPKQQAEPQGEPYGAPAGGYAAPAGYGAPAAPAQPSSPAAAPAQPSGEFSSQQQEPDDLPF